VTLDFWSPRVTPCHKSSAGTKILSYIQKLFLFEQHLTSKSCATLRQAFNGEYPDKEILSKTTVHRLVTKLWATGSVWSKKCVWCPAVYIDTCAITTEMLIPLSQESGIFATSTHQATKRTELRTTFQSLVVPLKGIKRRDSYSSSHITSTLLSPAITIYTTRFNVKNFYLLVIECCFVLCYCITHDYFSVQH